MPARRLDRVPVDLAGLSPDELKSLRHRVDALIGTPAPTPDDGPAEVIGAAVRHLIKRGGTNPPPAPVLRRMPWWKALEKGSRVVAEYLKKNAPDTMGKRQSARRAVYVVVGVLIRWMERVHVPVTLRTVALNLDKVPGIMDQQFPGYAANGLLEWVFNPPR